MRKIVHRHLGKVVAGAAIAVAGTAVMVGITLPGTAGADTTGGADGGGRSAQQAAQGQDAAAAVQPGVVEEAPVEGDRGKGNDPLTDDEITRVEKLAVNRQLFDGSENVRGARGPQRIETQLAEPEADEVDDANAPRRAEVTFYDYRDDTLVTRTVNLDTGKVEHTATQRGVQPPLSRSEETEAAKLLIADPLGAGLKADYKDATGKELTSPDQLQLNSMVYKANPGGSASVAKCGEHRCTRLFPKIKNGSWVDLRDFVIDLSARKVIRLG
ncbi:Tat pathway signal sequence domain protein [Streptomyces cyaneochromogenes]|uniref:Tat pathway signal sequence domain protein n=1 Tax=Streptomyces cyaneochromogenes TaxID=2496836 RepID=A0A3S9MGD3_9ACTN|nr:Tat pathway signal sequence domain protein [Streptomyces cyaneochromogenes]AZQ38247.1 Tat pathway signal sequence domain protein [Streptomyces cyaneochromogenes]